MKRIKVKTYEDGEEYKGDQKSGSRKTKRKRMKIIRGKVGGEGYDEGSLLPPSLPAPLIYS